MSGTLDTIKRTAYNADGDVVAVQTINVSTLDVDQLDRSGSALVTPASFTTARFKRVARIGEVQTTKSISSSGSETITSITTTGRFTSHAVSGNDVTAVTYSGNSTANDIVVPVGTLPGVLKVGDTV